MTYNKSESFHGSNEMAIVDYFNEFERLYNSKKCYVMALPTSLSIAVY